MDVLLYRYLILMKALFTMEAMEKERRSKSLEPVGEEQQKLVGEGIGFLKEIYHGLVDLREKFTKGIL